MKANPTQASSATSTTLEVASAESFEESGQARAAQGVKAQATGAKKSLKNLAFEKNQGQSQGANTQYVKEKNDAAPTSVRAASLQPSASSSAPDVELNALDERLKKRVDEQVLKHQFNYSWMPNPVTLSEAYQATGAKTPREFLQKISDQDPEAMRLGFTDRAFFDSELRKIMLEAAQKVALEIVDSRATMSAVRTAQKTQTPLVWDRKELIGHLLQQPGAQFSALPQTENAQAKAAAKQLQRDLKQLDTPIAQLVSSGLELALFERKAATDDANFIKNFNRRPLAKKLEFLTQYIAEHYGPQNANVARHSALDNPLILSFVENNLSGQDRNIFLTRFRSRNFEPAAQTENS